MSQLPIRSRLQILTKRSWIVRRLKWKVPDLYKGNKESIYWYNFGLNWRAFLAWALVVWPCFRKSLLSSTAIANNLHTTAGFVAAMTGDDISIGWQRAFKLSWVIGFCGGGLAYWVFCLVSPPPGSPYVVELLDMDDAIDGISMPSDVEVAASTIVSEKK